MLKESIFVSLRNENCLEAISEKAKGYFSVDNCDEYGWSMTTLLGTCDSSAIICSSLAHVYILAFLFSSLLDSLFRHLLREQVIFLRDSAVRYIFTFRLQLPLFLTFCSINRNDMLVTACKNVSQSQITVWQIKFRRDLLSPSPG
jgi:hypothetical protein